jgi:hypothetical protein
MNNIHLYAQYEPYGLIVRVGHSFASLAKAKHRAVALRALQVEVRNDALPRSRSLLTIFKEGHEVGFS